MIEASQRMLDVQSQVTGEAKESWGINPKLRKLLELKQRQKEKAMHIEDTQRG